MSENSPPRSDPHLQPLSSTITKKRRGGRQLRHVNLSTELRFSIRQFAVQVGMPRLMEPTGFRDFRGWLERVSGPSAADAWISLVDAMRRETAADAFRILSIKEEVVREIVRAIVVPRPGESAKLVSTNCGRQCARPRSGNTLMTILERVLIDRGIVSADDIETFMNDRASPPYTPASAYRETGALPALAATASAALPSAWHTSPTRRSMSLEAITSSADAARSAGPLPPVSDSHPAGPADLFSRSSFERAPHAPESHIARGMHRSSSSSHTVNVSTTPSTVSSQLGAMQTDQLTVGVRLPSFQELQKSLDEDKK